MSATHSFLGALSLGFRSSSPQMIVILVLCTASLILLAAVMNLYSRLSKLLKGKNSQSLEESIIQISKELHALSEYKKESEEYLINVEKRLCKSIQSVETVRFNPFKGTGAGGNQSFATAFINQNGDGLIVSTLYSSDRMSIFGKPIVKFASQFDLTEEENKVLTDATENLKKI